MWLGLGRLQWLLKSRHIHHGRDELFLIRAVFALVWKVAPSPPWSRKSRRIHIRRESPEQFFIKLCRLHVGLKSRAVSISVWKV